MEFDDLKVLVEKAVVDRGDHATLLWTEDLALESPGCRRRRRKSRCAFLERTTKRLAWESWQATSQGFPSCIVPERVVLSERPTCSAEISCDRA